METTAPLGDDRPRVRQPALWAWPAALLAMSLAAFFPTYFGRFPHFEGTSVSLHFHVTTMLLWLGLTLIQPILVARRQLAWHRRLGRLAYVLLPVIALGFFLVMRDGQLRRKEPDLVLATAFDAFFYFFLVGAGLFYRRRRAYHGAFMLMSLLPFLNPTLGRLISPAVSVTVELALLAALLVRARVKRLEMRPYGLALGAFLVALAALTSVMVAFPAAPERLWSLLFT